jgi:CAAX prenyl protease-like protein
MVEPEGSSHATDAAGWRDRWGLLKKHRWMPFVLPLVVYMLAGSLEPKLPAQSDEALQEAGDAATASGTAAEESTSAPVPYRHYPLVYMLKIALTAVAIWFVWPGYRQFRFRVSPVAVAVGAIGVVVWVGLCNLGFEQDFLKPRLAKIGLERFIGSGERSAYNPLVQLAGNPAAAWGFLFVRFLGLVAVVPLIEEFFYRGFLMPYMVDVEWWKVPPGKVNAGAVILSILVPVAMHPAELLAATAWFSMITVLYLRTRSVWACVVAHAVTNLLLGIYVVVWNQWHLM